MSKGFNWRRDQIDTMLLRIHSEITEAYAEYVKAGYRINSFFAEELADVTIRLFDCAEVMGVNLENLAECDYICDTGLYSPKSEDYESFGVFHSLLSIHAYITEAGEGIRKNLQQKFEGELANALLLTFGLATDNDINLEEWVRDKHAFNLQRPYLHGKAKMRLAIRRGETHINEITHETFKELS